MMLGTAVTGAQERQNGHAQEPTASKAQKMNPGAKVYESGSDVSGEDTNGIGRNPASNGGMVPTEPTGPRSDEQHPAPQNAR
jgi:hypothetical protein